MSSIKRIIAEDADATLSAPRVRRSVGGPARSPGPLEQAEVLELTDEVEVEANDAATTDQPVAAREISPPTSAPSLVSATTVEASRSSLAALSALVVKPEVVGQDTLEGLVREMLKPMLAEWLDARLPEVVDRLVAQEIARITNRG